MRIILQWQGSPEQPIRTSAKPQPALINRCLEELIKYFSMIKREKNFSMIKRDKNRETFRKIQNLAKIVLDSLIYGILLKLLKLFLFSLLLNKN